MTFKKHSWQMRSLKLLLQLAVTELLLLVFFIFLSPLLQLSWGIWPIQALFLLIASVTLYLTGWGFGDHDSGSVHSILPGLKSCIPTTVLYLILSLLPILAKFGVGIWSTIIYKFLNLHWIGVITFFLPADTPELTSWGALILFVLLTVWIPLVACIGYYAGLRRFSLRDYIMLKK